MRKFLFISSMLILFWLGCSREQPPADKIVATIGTAKITQQEFVNRFEFTPRLYRYANNTATKQHFLASLLGEKLLALQAREQQFDTLHSITLMTEQLQKEAIVEALFDKEVDQKINISESELQEAYARSQQLLFLKYFRVSTADNAQTALQRLARGESFEKVGMALTELNQIQLDSLPVKQLRWGEAVPELEDSVFTLRLNQFTGPTEVENQFYFFQLIDKRTNVFTTESDYNYWRPSIEQTIRRRRRNHLFQQFLGNLLQNTRATIPHQKFKYVVDRIEEILNIETTAETKPAVGQLKQLQQQDFLTLQTSLEDYLNEPFVIFSDGTHWTTKTVLERLTVGPYPLNFQSKQDFRFSLRQAIKLMIELERLATEGTKRGLDKSTYVKSETRMWEDSFLAHYLRQQLTPDNFEPSEEAVKAYYEKNKNRYASKAKIKIQEILVDDLNLANRLLQRIQSGEALSSLAKQYSKRTLTAANGGISDDLVEGDWGIVGRTAFEKEVGEWVGPLKTENGQFSIFKVLAKQNAHLPPLETVKSQVVEDIYSEHIRKTLEDFLCSQLKNVKLEINTPLLDSLKIIEQGSGMYVLKQHFPGRSAVPLVYPVDELSKWQEVILSGIQHQAKK